MYKKEELQKPSTQQIAELNALLRETERLSRQLNYPLTNTFSIFANGLMTLFLINMLDITSKLDRFIQANPLSAIPVTIMMGFIYFYTIYFIFQFSASQVAKCFPNGIGFSRVQNRAYEMQYKLGTKDEVAQAINELHSQINSQKPSNKGAFFSVYSSLALSYIRRLWSSYTEPALVTRNYSWLPSLKWSLFGPALAYLNESQTVITYDLLVTFCTSLQAIYIWEFIYNIYDNLNPAKELKSLLENIEKITNILPSSLNKWKLLTDPKMGKLVALFKLELSMVDQVKISHHNKYIKFLRIDSSNFIAELHRILLEAGLPVYCSKNKIYLGFCKLSEKQSFQMRTKLQSRLIEFSHYEKKHKSILLQLNSLGAQVGCDNVWRNYLELDKDGNIANNYYFSLSNIPPYLVVGYRNALSKIVGESSMRQTDHIITLTDIDELAIDPEITASLKKLHLDHRKSLHIDTYMVTADEGHQNNNVHHTHKKKSSSNTGVIKAIEHSSSEPSPLSLQDIKFKSGFCFFKNMTLQAKKPKNFAYPIDVPYLPSGHAFAIVARKVFGCIRVYVSKEEVIAQLERQKVHGFRQPGEGIQLVGQNSQVPPAYCDVDGIIHTSAKLKLKFNNNIRVYGDRYDELVNSNGERFVLYRFDGPGYGH